MKLLRETIRRLILEDYEFNDADMDKLRDIYQGESDEWIRQNADVKGIGMQGKEPINRDKTAMRQWHELMKQHPEFVKDFTQGRVQILHSLTYTGDYSRKGGTYASNARPFTDWIKKFGKTSKDQISCVAANAPIGEDPLVWEWEMGNAGRIYWEGYGFLMKGYPAFGSDNDMMTQTLSAIPDTLKDFHKNSGQVKRADSFKFNAIDPNNWLGIDELILDNWQIIGVYVTAGYFKNSRKSHVLKDAKSCGFPCWKVNGRNGTMERF